MERPKKLESIDLENLIKICEEYIDFLDSEEAHEDNDFDQYIFEQAITSIYGKKAFDWINDKF